MAASYFSREWSLPLGNLTVFLLRDEPPFWFPWEGGVVEILRMEPVLLELSWLECG